MTGPAPATGPVDERPPRGARSLAAVVLGLLLLLAMAGLSRVPWTAAEYPDGLLRLSWRFQDRMGERCRTPTPEELAELPVHMRNPDACLQEGLPYRLRVAVDDTLRVDRLIEPAGARGDRPVYVLDELGLEPGPHRVRITFEAEGAGPDSAPTGLRWSGAVRVASGHVSLVTRDPDTGRLELRTGASASGR